MIAASNPLLDISSCKFKISDGKLGTARVVVWKEFEVTNSFTLENSFHGYYHGEKFKEICSNDFIKLGADIISSVYRY